MNERPSLIDRLWISVLSGTWSRKMLFLIRRQSMKIFLLKDLQNSLEPQELQLSLARWEIFIFQKRNFVRLLLWKVRQDADRAAPDTLNGLLCPDRRPWWARLKCILGKHPRLIAIKKINRFGRIVLDKKDEKLVLDLGRFSNKWKNLRSMILNWYDNEIYYIENHL